MTVPADDERVDMRGLNFRVWNPPRLRLTLLVAEAEQCRRRRHPASTLTLRARGGARSRAAQAAGWRAPSDRLSRLADDLSERLRMLQSDWSEDTL